MTQCDEIGYFMLQNDADALPYTGITLETPVFQHCKDMVVIHLQCLCKLKFSYEVKDQPCSR